ncbi:MAG: WG repeat-containing protein [Chitinophagaceae bacterium]|nr:MAG: WG repeat-containing protein [Chitinophagaceae bacterium]
MKILLSALAVAVLLPAALRAQHPYDQVFPSTDGMAMVIKGDRAGFVNREGKEVVPPLYEAAFHFFEGRAVIQQDKKLGFIDKSGRVVIAPRYEYIGFHNGNPAFVKGVTAARLDGKWGVIDRAGKVLVPFRYDLIYGMSDGMAFVQCGTKAHNISFGFVNERGEEVVPCGTYPRIEAFSEGLAAVKVSGNLTEKDTDRWGFVDRTGKLVIPGSFQHAYSFSGGFANVKQDGKRFFIDKTGRAVLRPGADISYHSFGSGLCAVEDAAGKIGFINEKGTLVIDHQFDAAPYPFHKGVAAVSKGGKYGLIDAKGAVLAPFRYQFISGFVEDIAQLVESENQRGYIDVGGKVVLEPKYSVTSDFRDGEAIIRNQSGNWLTINKQGVKVFDSLKVTGEPAAAVTGGRKAVAGGTTGATTGKTDRAALIAQLKTAVEIKTSRKFVYPSGSARKVEKASLKEEGGKLVYRLRSQYDGLSMKEHVARFDPKGIQEVELVEGKAGSELSMVTLRFATEEVELADGTYKDWKTMMKEISFFFPPESPFPFLVTECFNKLRGQ